MGVYLIVLAAAIAVFGILFIYKRHVDWIKEDPSQTERVQRRFFIRTAMIEAVPLLLLIFGFIHLEAVPLETIYFPAVIIALFIVFSLFFILLQRAVDVNEENKQVVTNFSMIALVVTNAIPVIALVFLFMVVE